VSVQVAWKVREPYKKNTLLSGKKKSGWKSERLKIKGQPGNDYYLTAARLSEQKKLALPDGLFGFRINELNGKSSVGDTLEILQINI
jgi:hypothetical protein